jgi:hypothetical protein
MPMKLFKTNNIFFGMFMGVLAPVAGYFVLMLLNQYMETSLNYGQTVLKEDTIRMTSVFLNLFVYIPYLNKKEYEMTGRGVLLVTFTGVIIIFLTMF